MSKKLDEIRKQIDAHDNKIHDVLMERAALIDDVIAEKKKSGLQFVHPAREAQMVRRLLKRHSGPLPEEAIVRIWRELVGAMSLMQTGLKISVCMEKEEDVPLWEMARNYFGSVVTMQKQSGPLVSIASVREGESSFAVMPWPSDEDDRICWWLTLFQQESDLRIVGALPYGVYKSEGRDFPDQALIISMIDFAESGDDHSFLVFDLDQSISRARIVDVLQGAEAGPLSIHSKPFPDAGRTYHLVEVAGYIAQDDTEAIATILGAFDDPEARCRPLGGYPVPPLYRNGKSRD